MKTLIAAALMLGTATPALAQGTYRAAGTEPFWSVTIDARTMKFEAPDARSVTVATPRVIHGFAGDIYKTRRINVNVVHAKCSDGMSDRVYPDKVQVTVDGRRYEGCGGAATTAAQPGSVIEGPWLVERVNGVRARGARIRFDGAKVGGNTGCNSFGGEFRLQRGFFEPTRPMISTRRACGRPVNVQEHNLLDVLGQRLSVSNSRAGKLVLTGRNGKTLVLVRDRRGR